MTTWPALETLTPAEREGLLAAGRRRRFAKGEVIFHEGDPADALHLLDKGRVAVRVVTQRGEQAILVVLGPGSVFGELALIRPDAQRSATVSALQPVESIVIRRDTFTRLLQQHPGVTGFLLASLASQVERLSEHLLETLFAPAPRRVCNRLMILDREFGGSAVTITQDELALMVGATRATVNEILRDLERTGMIKISRGQVQIVDRPALARRAR